MKWANNGSSTLEKVTLVLFSQKDIYDEFPSILRRSGVPFKWYEYAAGRPNLKDSFAGAKN